MAPLGSLVGRVEAALASVLNHFSRPPLYTSLVISQFFRRYDFAFFLVLPLPQLCGTGTA